MAESLASDIGPVDGEASVLVQALISIRAIINLDPSCHEKVFSNTHLFLLGYGYGFLPFPIISILSKFMVL